VKSIMGPRIVERGISLANRGDCELEGGWLEKRKENTSNRRLLLGSAGSEEVHRKKGTKANADGGITGIWRKKSKDKGYV